MSATVGKLLQHMRTVSPAELYIEQEDDDNKPSLPHDPELKRKALEALSTKDIKQYFAVMGETLPRHGHKVFEDIFIGGKSTVEVYHYSL